MAAALNRLLPQLQYETICSCSRMLCELRAAGGLTCQSQIDLLHHTRSSPNWMQAAAKKWRGGVDLRLMWLCPQRGKPPLWAQINLQQTLADARLPVTRRARNAGKLAFRNSVSPQADAIHAAQSFCDAVDAAAAFNRFGLDLQSKLFLQRSGDGTTHGVSLPAECGDDLIDARAFRCLEHRDELRLFRVGARLARLAQHRR